MKIQQAVLQAKADNKLQNDLIEAQAQLDRAIAQINQLEKMSKSQVRNYYFYCNTGPNFSLTLVKIGNNSIVEHCWKWKN